jgi:hypothetical protein
VSPHNGVAKHNKPAIKMKDNPPAIQRLFSQTSFESPSNNFERPRKLDNPRACS